MVELTYNEQYKNWNLDLRKGVKNNEIVEFTLSFDQPRTGPSKFNPEKLWYKFAVEMQHNGERKNVQFFAAGQSPEDFVSLADWLMRFKKGDTITLQKSFEQGEKFTYIKWLSVGGEKPSAPTPSPTPVGGVKNPTPVRDKANDEIVEMLVKASKGEKKPDSWVQETLSNSGVNDFTRMREIVKLYQEQS